MNNEILQSWYFGKIDVYEYLCFQFSGIRVASTFHATIALTARVAATYVMNSHISIQLTPYIYIGFLTNDIAQISFTIRHLAVESLKHICPHIRDTIVFFYGFYDND